MEKLTNSASLKTSEVEPEMETKVVDKLPGNMDRLRPRGMEKGLKRPSSEVDANERKKQKEGHEEMEKLKTLVPTLRVRDGRVSQVDIIEETISYIDQLHRRIAERLVASTVELGEDFGEAGPSYDRDEDTGAGREKKPIVLTLDQVQNAERMSQEIECSTAGGFAARLEELSKSSKFESEIRNELVDSEDESSDEEEIIGNTNETLAETKVLNHENIGDSQSSEVGKDKFDKDSTKETAFNVDKPTDEEKRAIEAVKSSFVALLSSHTPDE